MSEGNQEDEKPPPEPQRPHQEDGALLSSTLPDMHCIKTLQATSASVLRMVSAIFTLMRDHEGLIAASLQFRLVEKCLKI